MPASAALAFVFVFVFSLLATLSFVPALVPPSLHEPVASVLALRDRRGRRLPALLFRDLLRLDARAAVCVCVCGVAALWPVAEALLRRRLAPVDARGGRRRCGSS